MLEPQSLKKIILVSLIRLPAGMALAISTDGVGTKLLVAQQAKQFREVAQDSSPTMSTTSFAWGPLPSRL